MKSKGEEKLETLLYKVFEGRRIVSQWPIKTGRKGYTKTLYVDFAIPALKLAFEVQGRQHFEYVPHFHKSTRGFASHRKRDTLKASHLETLGYKLIYFDYDEPITKKNLMEKLNGQD